MAALHRREPRSLAGDVVEHKVRERPQQHRVVRAQRLLDRLRVLGPLEDREHVRAARPAPERLRVVGLDEAEDEVGLAWIPVAEREAGPLEPPPRKRAKRSSDSSRFTRMRTAWGSGL